jgi:hypothetical protein
MKLAQAQSSLVASSGADAVSAFAIAHTPHMFNILSSGLYSDKVAAVLRELACNAADAHIAAGTPERPIEVKLPGALTPTFYVKDFGPGLNEQEVRELYTTYGWSSKQADNDTTGAFGLGSKSPFAYTAQTAEDSDGFTVVTVKKGEGVQRTFTCFIGDDGLPCVTKLAEEPASADWPHGLLVTFAVRPKDRAEFRTKAAQVLRWFRPLPLVSGLDQALAPPAFAFVWQKDGVTLSLPTSPEWHKLPKGLQARMGPVVYPIDISRLGALEAASQKLLLEALAQANAVFELPMGELDITPSREHLQYTPATCARLRQAFSQVPTLFAQGLEQSCAGLRFGSWAHACAAARFIHSLAGPLRARVTNLLPPDMPEGLQRLVASLSGDGGFALPNWVGSSMAAQSVPPQQRVRVWMYLRQPRNSRNNQEEVFRTEVVDGALPGMSDVRTTAHARLYPQRKPRLFWADSPGADGRLRQALEKTELSQALLVTAAGEAPATVAQEYAQRISAVDYLREIPVEAASSLPEVAAPVSRARASGSGRAKPGAAALELGAGTPAVNEAGNRIILNEKAVEALHAAPLVFYADTRSVGPTGQVLAPYYTSAGTRVDLAYLPGKSRMGELSSWISALAKRWGVAPAPQVLAPSAAKHWKFVESLPSAQPLLPWLHRQLLADTALVRSVVILRALGCSRWPDGKESKSGLYLFTVLNLPPMLGSLLQLRQAGVPAWAAIERRFSNSPLLRTVEWLQSHLDSRDPASDKQWPACDVLRCMLQFLRCVSGAATGLPAITELAGVCRRPPYHGSAFKGVNESGLRALLENAKGEAEIAKWLDFLEAVLRLEDLLDSPGLYVPTDAA